MNIRKKEIYNFLLESLPNTTQQEFIELVNNKYNTDFNHINNFDNIDLMKLADYIYMKVVLG